MSNISMAEQTAENKTVKIKSVVIKNTTSPEEKKHGSMNWTIICNVREILKFDLSKNLRISYGDASTKNRNAVHKAIYNSFDDEPKRFIQRNSGFTIVCDELKQTNKEEYGINTITLTNPSLINGGQTQGEIKRWFEENGEDIEYNTNTNIKIDVIVEKNQHEVHEICVARNNSTNVSDLSILGNKGRFNAINENMISVFGKDQGTLQMSETDEGVPTQTLLQILRAMTPKTLKESLLKENPITAYSGKGKCLTDYENEFAREEETRKESPSYRSPLLEFYRSFAPIAWKTYLDWVSKKEWLVFWKKSDNFKKLGKYNNQNDEFTLTWAIICPLLYGFQHFVHEKADGWVLEIPKEFDEKEYMKFIVEGFKSANFVPQEYAKDKSTYLLILQYMYDSDNS